MVGLLHWFRRVLRDEISVQVRDIGSREGTQEQGNAAAYGQVLPRLVQEPKALALLRSQGAYVLVAQPSSAA